MKKVKWLILLILISTILSAKNSSLEELIEIALSQNVSMKINKNNILDANSSLRSTYYGLLPYANFSASKQNYDGNNTTTFSSQMLIESKLSITDFSFNSLSYFDYKRALLTKKNSYLAFDDKKKSIVSDVLNLYVNVLLKQKQLILIEKELKYAQSIFAQSKSFYNNDRISELDLKNSELSVVRAEINYEKQKILLEQNRENLFTYLKIKDNKESLNDIDFSQYESKILPLKFDSNLAILQNINSLEQQKLSLQQSKLSILPIIELSANYQYSRFKDNISDAFYGINNNDDSYTVKLSFSYDLFDYLKKKEIIGRYKRSFTNSKMENEDYEINLKLSFEQEKRNLMNMQKTFKLSIREKELANETLKMYEKKYRLGLISFIDLDNERKKFYTIENNLIADEYNIFLKQQQIVKMISGKILGIW